MHGSSDLPLSIYSHSQGINAGGILCMRYNELREDYAITRFMDAAM